MKIKSFKQFMLESEGSIFMGIMGGDELYVTDDDSELSDSQNITKYLGKYIMAYWNNEECDIIAIGDSVDDAIRKSTRGNITYFDDMGSKSGAPSVSEIKNIIKDSYVHGDSDSGIAIFKVETPTDNYGGSYNYYTIDAGEM